MKKLKLPVCILLVLMLFVAPLTGLAEGAEEPAAAPVEETAELTATEAPEAAVEPESTEVPEEGADPEATEAPADETPSEEPAYSYSDGIDENGHWTGVTALDYVTLFDYKAVSIPSETHKIEDTAVQAEVNSILDSYTTSEQITDRAVADGETVNIDYVGSVDGVEFSGGSTGGAGTEVTIGVTSYIDDFLEQLIGHMPGETFNVEVTFPEDYGVDELNGKDAVFVTTINHIVETVKPTLTDDFVAENLAADNEWTTIAQMETGIRDNLQKNAIRAYIQERIIADSDVSSVPESMVAYQEKTLENYYQEYALMFGVDIDSFLSTYVGVANLDELKETYRESNVEAATFYLVAQAIAEDAKMDVTDADVADYFRENMGTEDYSEYEAQYGMPYLKQVTLCSMVFDRVIETAVLEA